MGEPYRVRVLFDAGSHRSFITSKAAHRAQLASIRQEWLRISTFGQRSKDMCLRDVVEVKVSPTDGQKVIPIEGYVVPEISSIQNSHVELAKGEYPHLKGLWFSDVCMGAGELEIDILVGADYLWSFQKDCTIGGGGGPRRTSRCGKLIRLGSVRSNEESVKWTGTRTN